MTESDKIPFAKLIGELAVAFKCEADKPLLAVYFKHLIPYTLWQVSLAVNEIIGSDDRFPVVARIRTLAATKKYEPPAPVQDVELLEEVALPNDLPRTKEDFSEAWRKLMKDVGVD